MQTKTIDLQIKDNGEVTFEAYRLITTDKHGRQTKVQKFVNDTEAVDKDHYAWALKQGEFPSEPIVW